MAENRMKGKIMESPKNWSIHAEFIVILMTLIGGFYLLDGKIERQGERTYKIYEMFIDLLKEGKRQ